ncbi:MAG: glucuronyl hydrolase [Saprospiraceae bacterium]
MKFIYPTLFAMLMMVTACQTEQPAATTLTELADPAIRLTSLAKKMEAHLQKIPLDSTKIPRALEADGSLIAKGSRQWTSGFFPGTLWHLYGHSKSQTLKTSAENWTAFIEKEKFDDHTHDLGFKLYCSFGTAYHITDNQAYKDIVVQASKTLIERYNPDIGAIRSWDWNADVWQYPVIVDNMMNLDMLFEATRLTGDSTFYHIAHQHAKTTLENHFRLDNSSYHVVVYDTTTFQPIMKVTHQGLNDESAWSRGQAWGLYGYTMAYGWTKDPAFLAQAKKIAQFFFNHPNLPEDKIPYWDFDAPNIPNEPRDVSAATVAASALLELQQYDSANKKQYLAWVDTILTSLQLEKYQSNVPPFLLDHSTGSVPGKFEVDVPITYGDYYYVEALRRRKDIE